MISLANIKIYANYEDLIIDTEMIMDIGKALYDRVSIFKLLIDKIKYEYTPDDLLKTEFHMIINFADIYDESWVFNNIRNLSSVYKFDDEYNVIKISMC